MEEIVKTYLHYKMKYPDALLLIGFENYYYAFNSSAFTLQCFTGGVITSEVINNSLYFYTAKPRCQWQILTDKLRNKGFSFCFIDQL